MDATFFISAFIPRSWKRWITSSKVKHERIPSLNSAFWNVGSVLNVYPLYLKLIIYFLIIAWIATAFMLR